jgi:hypothetical protein
MKEKRRKITFEARGWKRPTKISRFPSSSIVELKRTLLFRFIVAKGDSNRKTVFQKVSQNVK